MLYWLVLPGKLLWIAGFPARLQGFQPTRPPWSKRKSKWEAKDDRSTIPTWGPPGAPCICKGRPATKYRRLCSVTGAHLHLSAEPGLTYLEASQVQVPTGPKVAPRFAETQSQLGSELVGGFPGGSFDKESACNAGDSGSNTGEDPLEKGMSTHSSILA